MISESGKFTRYGRISLATSGITSVIFLSGNGASTISNADESDHWTFGDITRRRESDSFTRVEFAYAPEIWRDFFSVVALAAATLTGLLAVALSMHTQVIAASASRLARAREAIIALTVLLTLSILALIPGQGRVALGVELIVVSIVVLAESLRLEGMTFRRLPADIRPRWMIRVVGLNSATVAVGISGASLMAGRFGGLLWLIYSTLYCLIWSTYNAWSLTIRMPGALEGERADESPPDV